MRNASEKKMQSHQNHMHLMCVRILRFACDDTNVLLVEVESLFMFTTLFGNWILYITDTPYVSIPIAGSIVDMKEKK